MLRAPWCVVERDVRLDRVDRRVGSECERLGEESSDRCETLDRAVKRRGSPARGDEQPARDGGIVPLIPIIGPECQRNLSDLRVKWKGDVVIFAQKRSVGISAKQYEVFTLR